MALTLLQARTDVRAYTRHVNDTVRLTNTVLNGLLNESYRELRTALQDLAPSLYVTTSANISIPNGGLGQEVDLTTLTRFERLHLVEWQLTDGTWVEVERARTTGYNYHATGRITFHERGTRLVFGPDNEVQATVRIQYHTTPADLSADGDSFELPEALLMALKYKTSAKVILADGDDPKLWLTLADDALKGGSKALKTRYGAHPKRAGLRRVMGY